MLVLACWMVLVLSLAVLTTVHWGHTVHERIRLQNNADAAAFSLAAVEARAFNLYAYTNRAQVSHDVSAMAWQSSLSFVYFLEAFVVDVNGMVKTFAGDCRRNPLDVRCLVRKMVPVVDVIISTLQTVLGLAHAFFQWLPLADRTIGKGIIPLHQQLNEALAGTAEAVMRSALASVESQVSAVVRDNDPDIDLSAALQITTPVNRCLFARPHMRESGISPFSSKALDAPLDPSARSEDSKVARAKRVMGGIANATRYFCDNDSSDAHCPTAMTTSRTWEDVIPGNWDKVAELLGAKGHRGEDDSRRMKWGQTRLLTHGVSRGYLRSKVSAPDAPVGMLAQGDNLGADDVYRFWGSSLQRVFERLGLCRRVDDVVAHCWGEPSFDDATDGDVQPWVKTSIWALNKEESAQAGFPGKSLHWRVAYPRDGAPQSAEARLGLTHHSVGPLTVYTANVQGIWEDNHPWRGVTPFPHFEPGQFEDACEGEGGTPSLKEAALGRSEFNQPSSWVVLSKTPEQLRRAGTNEPALLNPQGRLDVQLLGSDATVVLKNDRSSHGLGLGPGMHAVSRAQTYYHRPGNWAEMPNFFNPYWRARLASVYQGRASFPLVGRWLAWLPEPLRGAPQKVITH